jgi:hypothetical protein
VSGTEATSLAAMAAGADDEHLRTALESFRREAQVARQLWDAWLIAFDKAGRHQDGNYSSALKTFIARYELFLKDGA